MPVFTTQISPIDSARPGKVQFSRSPLANPFIDTSMGYLVLRNSTNNFSIAPQSGNSYQIGNSIGTAMVIGRFNRTDSLTIRDITNIVTGGDYNYRVYAYRYGADNVLGNNTVASRGTSYDTINFVTAQATSVLNFSTAPKVIYIYCTTNHYTIGINNIAALPQSLNISPNGFNPISKELFTFSFDKKMVLIKLEKQSLIRKSNLLKIDVLSQENQHLVLTSNIPSQLCDSEDPNIRAVVNLSAGVFQIIGDFEEENIQCQIYDLSNVRKILTIEGGNNGNFIDLSSYNSGNYLVVLTKNNKQTHIKVSVIK